MSKLRKAPKLAKVGLEDIGKRVKLDGKSGYVLLSIRHTPGGLQAEIFNRTLYTISYYMLTDISKDPNQSLDRP